MKVVIYARGIITPLVVKNITDNTAASDVNVKLNIEGVEAIHALLNRNHDVEILLCKKLPHIQEMKLKLLQALESNPHAQDHLKVTMMVAGRESHHLHHHDVAIVSNRFRELLLYQAESVYRAPRGIIIHESDDRVVHAMEKLKACAISNVGSWMDALIALQ